MIRKQRNKKHVPEYLSPAAGLFNFAVNGDLLQTSEHEEGYDGVGIEDIDNSNGNTINW